MVRMRGWVREEATSSVRLERWLVAGLLTAVATVVYNHLARYNLERLAHGRVAAVELRTVFDDVVPLVPEAIWVYLLYYPLLWLPFLWVRDRRELRELVIASLATWSVGWSLWLLVPARMHYPELACARVSCRLLAWLWAVDGGTNLFPSFHAARAAIVAGFAWSYRGRLGPRFSVILMAIAVAIGASTVLVKQHYLIDVPAGALLGLGAWTLARWTAEVLPAREEVLVRVRTVLRRR